MSQLVASVSSILCEVHFLQKASVIQLLDYSWKYPSENSFQYFFRKIIIGVAID